jgi:hypothetical protein
MYIRINKQNIVQEIIPDIDPNLPGVDVSQRYPADFVAALIQVADGTDVEQGYTYDPDTGTFTPPEPPDLTTQIQDAITALEALITQAAGSVTIDADTINAAETALDTLKPSTPAASASGN